MIVSTDELREHRGRCTLVDGGFDPLHAGHVEYLRRAAELGLPVLCNVSGDHWVSRKHPPVVPEDQRVRVLDAIRYIDFTHLSRGSTWEVLEALQPRFYVKGKDWEGRLPEDELAVCRKAGTEVVYLDTVTESSSALLREALRHRQQREEVRAFEALVAGQRPVDPSHYDNEYFQGDWRPEGNRYEIEARRPIEGRHPELIREVFQPRRVLDVGCGPGILMFLLSELGIEADGVDFSPHARDLAPPEVRDRIALRSVTDEPPAEGAWDLVICREVLEHLTVLEIRRAVAAMVKASSRFVYLTTRFHPDPPGLLSVDTQLDVDPTHITLLNMELLRVLFLLEGCRSRDDLAKAMDWMDKGRVLVFEKRDPVSAG